MAAVVLKGKLYIYFVYVKNYKIYNIRYSVTVLIIYLFIIANLK